MSPSRTGVRALGLCALVFCLLAIGPVAAQAELGSSWGYKEGAKLPQFGTALEPLVGTLLENHGVLSTTIGKTKIEILCSSMVPTEMKLEAVGRVRGKLSFAGCVFKAEGKSIEACLPSSAGFAVGTMQTAMLEGLIRLHPLGDGTKDETVLFKPMVMGTNLVVILTGPECAFGEKFPVAGEFSVKDCENAFLVHKEDHLAEVFAPLTKLTLLSNVATLTGSAFVYLLGEHGGLSWAGTPG